MFYQITSLFSIFNCDKPVTQADLFKLRYVKRVISQGPVINTDSDAYACLRVVSLCMDHMISKIKNGNKNGMDIRILNYCKSD